jgi:uncharacterized protein YndB with AHSA1/START domain/DNA-binding transcriptional ArsR family regulator
MDDHLVFRALSDPTRRLLLDRLFERDGRTLSELCEDVEMTRFGVMKHLRLLEDAGLVVATRAGREKRHYLNPVPIRLIHDRWISKYAVRSVAALAELKTTLEGSDSMPVDVTTKPLQIYQVFIRATPEQIWEAITSPEFTSRYFYGTRVESDLEAGSPIVYRSGNSDDMLVEGEVISSDPPRRLVHTWRALYSPDLAADPPSRVSWELEPADGGVTRLTVTHDGFETETATFTSVAGGWNLVLDGLKTLLETGTPLQAA